MFHSLKALPDYNPILKATVDILIRCNIDLRVVHIPGAKNSVTDALSRLDTPSLKSKFPDMVLSQLQTPRLPLGAPKK